MRILLQFKSMLKEGIKGLWRNKGMGLASIISITAVLMIFGIVLMLVLNVNKVVYETGAKLDKIVLFLDDEVTEEQRNQIVTTLEKNEKVSQVTFVSKDEALQEFMQQMEDKEYIFEGVEGVQNPLPDSLTVELSSLEDAQEVVDEVKEFPEIIEVQYFNDLIEKMIRISNGVKYGGGAIVIVLLFVAIVLIHNTIKITLTNRHKEIHIMKYVGASNGYIRGPFLLEGIFFGVIGALLATGIVIFVYHYLFQQVNTQLSDMIGVLLINPDLIVKDVSIIFACLGVGIGYIGSVISVSRFLDV